MTTTTLECPKCQDAELEFECETQHCDDGIFPLAGFLETENRQCECEFSTDEIIALENQAADDFMESRGLEP